MKYLVVFLLLSACKQLPSSWDTVNASYRPVHVSGSGE